MASKTDDRNDAEQSPLAGLAQRLLRRANRGGLFSSMPVQQMADRVVRRIQRSQIWVPEVGSVSPKMVSGFTDLIARRFEPSKNKYDVQAPDESQWDTNDFVLAPVAGMAMPAPRPRTAAQPPPMEAMLPPLPPFTPPAVQREIPKEEPAEARPTITPTPQVQRRPDIRPRSNIVEITPGSARPSRPETPPRVQAPPSTPVDRSPALPEELPGVQRDVEQEEVAPPSLPMDLRAAETEAPARQPLTAPPQAVPPRREMPSPSASQPQPVQRQVEPGRPSRELIEGSERQAPSTEPGLSAFTEASITPDAEFSSPEGALPIPPARPAETAGSSQANQGLQIQPPAVQRRSQPENQPAAPSQTARDSGILRRKVEESAPGAAREQATFSVAEPPQPTAPARAVEISPKPGIPEVSLPSRSPDQPESDHSVQRQFEPSSPVAPASRESVRREPASAPEPPAAPDNRAEPGPATPVRPNMPEAVPTPSGNDLNDLIRRAFADEPDEPSMPQVDRSAFSAVRPPEPPADEERPSRQVDTSAPPTVERPSANLPRRGTIYEPSQTVRRSSENRPERPPEGPTEIRRRPAESPLVRDEQPPAKPVLPEPSETAPEAGAMAPQPPDRQEQASQPQIQRRPVFEPPVQEMPEPQRPAAADAGRVQARPDITQRTPQGPSSDRPAQEFQARVELPGAPASQPSTAQPAPAASQVQRKPSEESSALTSEPAPNQPSDRTVDQPQASSQVVQRSLDAPRDAMRDVSPAEMPSVQPRVRQSEQPSVPPQVQRSEQPPITPPVQRTEQPASQQTVQRTEHPGQMAAQQPAELPVPSSAQQAEQSPAPRQMQAQEPGAGTLQAKPLTEQGAQPPHQLEQPPAQTGADERPKLVLRKAMPGPEPSSSAAPEKAAPTAAQPVQETLPDSAARLSAQPQPPSHVQPGQGSEPVQRRAEEIQPAAAQPADQFPTAEPASRVQPKVAQRQESLPQTPSPEARPSLTASQPEAELRRSPLAEPASQSRGIPEIKPAPNVPGEVGPQATVAESASPKAHLESPAPRLPVQRAVEPDADTPAEGAKPSPAETQRPDLPLVRRTLAQPTAEYQASAPQDEQTTPQEAAPDRGAPAEVAGAPTPDVSAPTSGAENLGERIARRFLTDPASQAGENAAPVLRRLTPPGQAEIPSPQASLPAEFEPEQPALSTESRGTPEMPEAGSLPPSEIVQSPGSMDIQRRTEQAPLPTTSQKPADSLSVRRESGQTPVVPRPPLAPAESQAPIMRKEQDQAGQSDENVRQGASQSGDAAFQAAVKPVTPSAPEAATYPEPQTSSVEPAAFNPPTKAPQVPTHDKPLSIQRKSEWGEDARVSDFADNAAPPASSVQGVDRPSTGQHADLPASSVQRVDRPSAGQTAELPASSIQRAVNDQQAGQPSQPAPEYPDAESYPSLRDEAVARKPFEHLQSPTQVPEPPVRRLEQENRPGGGQSQPAPREVEHEEASQAHQFPARPASEAATVQRQPAAPESQPESPAQLDRPSAPAPEMPVSQAPAKPKSAAPSLPLAQRKPESLPQVPTAGQPMPGTEQPGQPESPDGVSLAHELTRKYFSPVGTLQRSIEAAADNRSLPGRILQRGSPQLMAVAPMPVGQPTGRALQRAVVPEVPQELPEEPEPLQPAALPYTPVAPSNRPQKALRLAELPHKTTQSQESTGKESASQQEGLAAEIQRKVVEGAGYDGQVTNVQRVAASGGEAAANEPEPQLDLEALATKVYPFIKRLLAIERERFANR